MNLALEKLEKYGFNRKELGERDFFEICKAENITVLEIDAPTSFYFRANGKGFIVIRKKLKGLQRTFAMFHELAHHFLHGGNSGESAFFFGLLESKAETEADALACIALIPQKRIGDFSFLDEHPNRYAKQLFRNRQKLKFLYGI